MIRFDQAQLYQFVLFFDEQAEPPREALAGLATVVSRAVQGVQGLGLRFGQPETGQSLVLQAPGGGALSTGEAMTWRAGSGVWRLVSTFPRIDVYFDARGYEDVTETPVTLAQASSRLLPNLAEVGVYLNRRVNRLALAVTAQATCGPGEPRPSHVVAATFLKPELAQGVTRGEITDAQARVNHQATWIVEQGSEMRVNRNEVGTANWAVRNGAEEASLTWQWDVNTSVTQALTANLNRQSVVGFFQRAEEWVSERQRALQAIQ